VQARELIHLSSFVTRFTAQCISISQHKRRQDRAQRTPARTAIMSSFPESNSSGARRIEVIVFDGKDFGLWKTRIEGLFMAHDLLDVVENSVIGQAEQETHATAAAPAASVSSKATKQDSTVSAAAAARDEVRRRSNRAYGILVQCLQDEQLRLMQNVKRGDAHGVWRILLDTYERKSMATKVQLLERLFALTKQASETITSYIARLTEIERKLNAQEEKVSESILVYVLLRGLPASYTSIVQLIKMKDQLEMKDAIEMLKNEEERQGVTITGQPRTAAANMARSSSATGHNEARCFTCNQTGHVMFNCPRNSNKKKCELCRKVGHTAQECHGKQGGGDSTSNYAAVESAY
jgi:hypothetical protein